MVIQGPLSHGAHLCFRPHTMGGDTPCLLHQGSLTGVEAAEVDAEEAAMVSEEGASGKIGRREGEEDGLLKGITSH